MAGKTIGEVVKVLDADKLKDMTLPEWSIALAEIEGKEVASKTAIKLQVSLAGRDAVGFKALLCMLDQDASFDEFVMRIFRVGFRGYSEAMYQRRFQ